MNDKRPSQEPIILTDKPEVSAEAQFHALLEDALIRNVYESWMTSRKGNIVPYKSDIDPLMFAPALPFIWVYDYLAEERNFRSRLAGEEVQLAWGIQTVGHLLSDYLIESHREEVLGRWVSLMETPKIQLGVLSKLGKGRVERLCLPVADSDGNLNLLYGATNYRDGSAVERELTSSGYPDAMVELDRIYQVKCIDL